MRRAEAIDHHLDLFEGGKAGLAALPQERTMRISGRDVSVTPVFYAYWKFAAARQEIFFRRLARSNSVDTPDPVLARFRFTNAYRASDRVSQYLIRNVIYRSDLPRTAEEVFFRILLFKLFNKIETWQALEKEHGNISLGTYRFESFDKVLTDKLLAGDRIYSAAYIMPSCGNVFGYKYKHQNHLKLVMQMIEQRYPERISAAASMSEVFRLLLSVPSIGPFLAYQFATDINYSELTNFDESTFVVAGPGALDGISKCFVDAGKIPPEHLIEFMHEGQDQFFAELGLNFRSLWGRPLQLIDCQNIFCEISKYARMAFPEISGVAGRTRIKQRFSYGMALPAPWYPPKWGINELVER